MELKYLHTFKVIAETGGFIKAAEKLNYAQSTITLQMQLLEKELSLRLFEKVGRRMELTEAGKGLLPYVDAVLLAVEQMESYGKDSQELGGSLRVAMPETLLSYVMPQVLKDFSRAAPHVKLSLQTSNCYDIREQVMNGTVDLGVHYDVGGYGASLVVEKLQDYRLVLVGSPELKGNGTDFQTAGQKKEACLLTMDKNSLYHKIFEEYLRKADIAVDREMELGSTEAVKRGVMGNLGVSFLPAFTVEKELEEKTLVKLPVSVPEPTISSVCTWHKNKWKTPAMELFIRLCQADVHAS